MSAHRTPRGFTLTELMVAVLVLIVVIVAASKIFGTASRVTGVGQAGAAVLQEAAAIERQIRSDFERLSHEGLFIIRCVAVPNDVNVANGGGLLNAALSPNVYIRADQLLFFAHGAQTIQTMSGATGASRKGQGAVSRIYYGAAFQLADGDAAKPPNDPVVGGGVVAQDARLDPGDPLLVPWYLGLEPRNVVWTLFRNDPFGGPQDDYDTSEPESINATQPPASRWLLARHAVVLVDDGDNTSGTDYKVSYLAGMLTGGATRTADWIDHAVVRGGRIDAVASELSEIRITVLDADVDGNLDTWQEQRETIAGALFYPRAERVAPETHRVDQALTNHVIAGACSSFIIDWTWERGVGPATGSDGTRYRGFWDPWVLPDLAYLDQEHPWFGLDPDDERGVKSYRDYWDGLEDRVRPRTIFPDNIDPSGLLMTPAADAIADTDAAGEIVVYEAIFGYNQDRPLDPLTDDTWLDDPTTATVAYTPWPSSLRITMILHDSETKLEAGRQVQFVIDLPRQQ